MNIFNDLNKYSANTAVVTEQVKEISYKDLLADADDIGRQIKKRSLIFVVCKNCYESIAGYLGLLRAGMVLALVNHRIDDLLFTNLLKIYKPEYVYLPADKTQEGNSVYFYGDYKLFKTDYKIDYDLNDELALLLTTSGSTGSPKMVRLSYKNITSNARAIAKYLEIKSADRPITTMPMSYSYGLSIINSHLLKGASMVLTEATLMEKRFWDMMKISNTTTFSGVPYTYEMLKKLHFEKMDLPSLKCITQAGGKLSSELSVEFADICAQKGVKFYVMYGQTEATARMAYLPWQYARSRAGSMGKAIPGGRFWIEDEAGNIIEESESIGQLVYQGENVSLGYAENCYDLSKGDENKGVLYTGDMAMRDADGFYYVAGRKRRFLKIFGNRVNLNEVEQIVKDAGYECACAGSDDNLVIYVTKPQDVGRVRNYITERTGINQSGVTVVCVDEIPRNESGKVLYSALPVGVS